MDKGFNRYHAEFCIKQEHDEDEYIEISELKKIKSCPSCGAKMNKEEQQCPVKNADCNTQVIALIAYM